MNQKVSIRLKINQIYLFWNEHQNTTTNFWLICFVWIIIWVESKNISYMFNIYWRSSDLSVRVHLVINLIYQLLNLKHSKITFSVVLPYMRKSWLQKYIAGIFFVMQLLVFFVWALLILFFRIVYGGIALCLAEVDFQSKY